MFLNWHISTSFEQDKNDSNATLTTLTQSWWVWNPWKHAETVWSHIICLQKSNTETKLEAPLVHDGVWGQLPWKLSQQASSDRSFFPYIIFHLKKVLHICKTLTFERACTCSCSMFCITLQEVHLTELTGQAGQNGHLQEHKPAQEEDSQWNPSIKWMIIHGNNPERYIHQQSLHWGFEIKTFNDS